MVTRNVVLTDAQSELLERLVESGRYQNASEVLRAGLRLLESEEAAAVQLHRRLMDGLVQAQAGELAEGTGAEAIGRAFAKARGRR